MDCIEARALKSRFLSTVKTNSEVFYNDDVWCLTRINSVASDDFPFEELLNLDGEGFFQEEEGFDKGISHISSSSSSSSSVSGADELDTLSAGELSVPVDDLENLEWLSQFVNDSTSLSEISLLYPVRSFTAAKAAKTSVVDASTQLPPSFLTSVPSKARSKRSLKPNGRLWSLPSPLSSAADSSSTPSSSLGSSTHSSLVLITAEALAGIEKPPAKRQKRKPDGDAGTITGRRCMHCQVQKTPQWRTGPHGPKTLCNACGVRFKSGRLFPEYRPACSPTFSQEVHSNSHRKVLEMRRRKETAEPEGGLTGTVQIV